MLLTPTPIKRGLPLNTPLLFDIEAKLVTDITHYARLIEMACDDILKPPPEGIYASGQLEPVMRSGISYFTREGTETVPMLDINAATKTVYLESGAIAVPGVLVKNKITSLSNVPFLPYRGIQIVKLLIEDHLDLFVLYRKQRRNCYARLAVHFVEGSDAYLTHQTEIENACNELFQELSLFLGDKKWNMYFASLKNTHVHIDRGVDYRIYCWEMEHGEAFKNGTYRTNF